LGLCNSTEMISSTPLLIQTQDTIEVSMA
jgi:hypothetical protein